ncbi:MAG: LacI family DNA-binding transcriptional regulator [Gemmatimonadota bacterium]|nr:MAG: LacI family DNA-binding transcriptional regulator [Gemmatimonadota bacterium]
MSVTIYDVAKRAGVGIGTVSRAINNSGSIAPRTKEKVLAVVKELGYRPHASARGLARRRTNTIGVVVPFFTGYFFVELLRGIQGEVSKFQYDLILYNVDETNKKEMILRKVLQERKVDGMLLISLEMTNNEVWELRRSRLPIVLVDSYHPDLDSVTVENRRGAYVATQHLIRQGHSRIGMIDGHLKSSPARVRLEGYKNALRDHDIGFRREYLVISDYVTGEDGFNRKAGYQAMKQLLHLGSNRPTAVFVSSDIQAIGAMKAIEEDGLNVPNDMAIVGFDDIELAQYIGLTTMRQPMFEMGKLAVDRLVECITDVVTNGFKKVFHTSLIVRNTCGALRHQSHNQIT